MSTRKQTTTKHLAAVARTNGEKNPHFTGTVSQQEEKTFLVSYLVARGLRKSVGSRSSTGFSIVWKDARYRLRARACSHRHRYFPFWLSPSLCLSFSLPGFPLRNKNDARVQPIIFPFWLRSRDHSLLSLSFSAPLLLSLSLSLTFFLSLCYAYVYICVYIFFLRPFLPSSPRIFSSFFIFCSFLSEFHFICHVAQRNDLRGKLFSGNASTAFSTDFQWVCGPLAFHVIHRWKDKSKRNENQKPRENHDFERDQQKKKLLFVLSVIRLSGQTYK